jgi:hypothetical protein
LLQLTPLRFVLLPCMLAHANAQFPLVFAASCCRALLEEALQLERQLYVALLAESLSKEEDEGGAAAAAAGDGDTNDTAAAGKASLAKLLKQGPPGKRNCAALLVCAASCAELFSVHLLAWVVSDVDLLAESHGKEEDKGDAAAAAAAAGVVGSSDGAAAAAAADKASLAKLLKQGPPGRELRVVQRCI